ncbi:MAG: hypothetical protein ACR2GM_09970, partial [Nocardioidaceae bacterium]
MAVLIIEDLVSGKWLTEIVSVEDSDQPTAQADITHRRHAIIETVLADLIDGPLAHLPSGRFAAN